MKRKPSISHYEAQIRELHADPEFAAEYLRAALEEDDEPAVLLVALRHIAEALLRWPRRLALNAKVCIGLYRFVEILGSLLWWLLPRQLGCG